MKIGLLMAGISYGYKSDRDFRHCFPNISKNLIEPLKEFHEVETFISTYEHKYITEMEELYKPVKTRFIPYEGATQLSTRADCLDLVSNLDIDFYIMTRFDVHFNKPFSQFNLDFNKFNIVSREGNGFWEREKFIGDTFFAWPKFLHAGVLKTFEDLKQVSKTGDWRHEGKHNHNFYLLLSPNIGEDNIHFMFNNYQLSGHELTNCCTKDYADRLRGIIPVNEEILARFP